MGYVVAKPFSSFHRVFSVGQDVAAEDITGPMTFDDWCVGGFIVPRAPEQPAPEQLAPPPVEVPVEFAED